jgi:hypothetical protein
MTMKNFSRPNAALDVAGYPQNGRDGRAGRGSNRLGHNVEIETYLRSNHRQVEQYPDYLLVLAEIAARTSAGVGLGRIVLPEGRQDQCSTTHFAAQSLRGRSAGR